MDTTHIIMYCIIAVLSLVVIYVLCQLHPVTKKYANLITTGFAAIAVGLFMKFITSKIKPPTVKHETTDVPVTTTKAPVLPVETKIITTPAPIVAVTLDYQLSPNFTFGMMTKTEHRDLLEKNRQEALKYLDNLAKLCNGILEPIRTMIDSISITSGFRCKELNKAIGGAVTSQHCDGEAADTIYSNTTLKQVFNKIAFSNIQYAQIIYEFEQWIHISLIDEKLHPNKKLQKLIASRKKQPDGTTKTVYTIVDKPL